MSLSKLSVRGTLLGLLAAIPFTSAHTWIEQMMVIAPNGTLVGTPGFARGNVLRSSPGFGDPSMVNLLPPDGRTINEILSTDLMCKSTQIDQNQTDGSPRLQAAAGSAVSLRYQENGHVTLPQNQPGKPGNRGTVYVYGTTQPSPDDAFLAIHRVWNADGTGGDGRGVLLSTQNFDDGQCYQVNGGTISQQRQKQFPHPTDSLMGADLWCQQDIQIPSTAPSGQPYTLYWVWDWPTLPGTSGFPDGKQEIYTTCMDIDIVDDGSSEAFSKADVSFDQGQALDNAAVSAELTDIANPTAVSGTVIPFSASATGPVSGGASLASAAASATETDTGIPAFLSVHTGSVTGAGVETQTFSVMPISVTYTTTQEVSTPTVTAAATTAAATTGFSGHGGHNGNGNGNGTGNAEDAAVATFTAYDSITQTVFETVYQTKYTKRAEAPAPTVAPFRGYQVSAQAPAVGASTAHPAFRLRARNPFAWFL
ncbi:hypothetical protein PV11_03727 [Exophiala sideris]|uniref:DUF7492 domain-containing protein n=1 Tax=Exophiala sideris TaxID=1016849 RepID=A0A0D1X243_9EURO|nr:hypothetical protein PV11_03727 [Exophiala sideris]